MRFTFDPSALKVPGTVTFIILFFIIENNLYSNNAKHRQRPSKKQTNIVGLVLFLVFANGPQLGPFRLFQGKSLE